MGFLRAPVLPRDGRRRRGIFQDFNLLSALSALENVTIVAELARVKHGQARKKAAALLTSLGLGDRLNFLPEKLSGGEKQRVAIARTLLKNPKILILDDSTSSVDTETEAEIRSAIENLMSDRTTFIIAHRIQSVMSADLIVILENGQTTQIDTHDELVRQDGMYRQIFDIQTRIEYELEEEINHFK